MKLTIGMSTYDDYDGVYFTIQSLRMHHPILKEHDIEFFVLDNNPTSKYGRAVEKYIKSIKGTYMPYTEKTSSFSKYEILKHAKGDYYLGVDCHVLLSDGAMSHLIDYFKKNPNTNNIIQGPLIYDSLDHISTQWREEWSGCMYGKWHTDTDKVNIKDPYEIPMIGMGLFACKKSNFPKINENFKGFGGEEWYIHQRFRMNGGKCISIPQLKWLHRFGRPSGTPYINSLNDRVWNYYLGWAEIYGTPDHPKLDEIEKEFSKHIDVKQIRLIKKEALAKIFGK